LDFRGFSQSVQATFESASLPVRGVGALFERRQRAKTHTVYLLIGTKSDPPQTCNCFHPAAVVGKIVNSGTYKNSGRFFIAVATLHNRNVKLFQTC
jgi:hypothetical protein